MYLNTENVDARVLEDPDFPNSLTELTENIIAWGLDDPDVFNPMKGILIATPISLSLWAVIILVLSKLI